MDFSFPGSPFLFPVYHNCSEEANLIVVGFFNDIIISYRKNQIAFTGTLCTAAAISRMREASFSMALPTTITSAPALQLR